MLNNLKTEKNVVQSNNTATRFISYGRMVKKKLESKNKVCAVRQKDWRNIFRVEGLTIISLTWHIIRWILVTLIDNNKKHILSSWRLFIDYILLTGTGWLHNNDNKVNSNKSSINKLQINNINSQDYNLVIFILYSFASLGHNV